MKSTCLQVIVLFFLKHHISPFCIFFCRLPYILSVSFPPIPDSIIPSMPSRCALPALLQSPDRHLHTHLLLTTLVSHLVLQIPIHLQLLSVAGLSNVPISLMSCSCPIEVIIITSFRLVDSIHVNIRLVVMTGNSNISNLVLNIQKCQETKQKRTCHVSKGFYCQWT